MFDYLTMKTRDREQTEISGGDCLDGQDAKVKEQFKKEVL